jgi:hypothetical protein
MTKEETIVLFRPVGQGEMDLIVIHEFRPV